MLKVKGGCSGHRAHLPPTPTIRVRIDKIERKRCREKPI